MQEIKKVRFMKSKTFSTSLLLIVACLVLVISGCSIGNNTTYANKKYYQGYDSLSMSFVQNSPPLLFNYDPTGFNEIPIVVQVNNKGASDACGGIYIHGFDPHMIEVAGGKYPTTSNINYNVGTNGALNFNIGGIYVGLQAGNGGNNAAGVNLGFISPSGQRYGLDAYTQDGQLKGLNIVITPDRIGYGTCQVAFSDLITNPGWRSVIALEGNTENSPGGGVEVYYFPAYMYAYSLPDSLEQFRQPIWITSCFGYATKSTALICLDPRPNSGTKKACIPQTVSLSGGQGGPVSVNAVEQKSSSTKVIFTIHVHLTKTDSQDELYDYASLGKCNPDSGQLVRPTDKNVVYIGDITLSGQSIVNNCFPDRRIRLDSSGNGDISCTAYFDGTSGTAYEAPLSMELWYGYSKSIYKTITIKKI